jgi:hypothetical protein
MQEPTWEVEYLITGQTSHSVLLVKASSEFEAKCNANRDHGIPFGHIVNVRKLG